MKNIALFLPLTSRFCLFYSIIPQSYHSLVVGVFDPMQKQLDDANNKQKILFISRAQQHGTLRTICNTGSGWVTTTHRFHSVCVWWWWQWHNIHKKNGEKKNQTQSTVCCIICFENLEIIRAYKSHCRAPTIQLNWYSSYRSTEVKEIVDFWFVRG